MFKTCLIAFGNVFVHFENVKFFPVSWSCSRFRHSWVHWAFFFGGSYLRTSSKLVWTLLGTFLDTSEISKLRFCFPFVPSVDPAWHDDFKKSPGNMFEHCWVRFWTFLKNWNFSIFLNFFQLSTLQCVIAVSFRKKYLKTSSEQVWTLLGTVLDTLEILKFSIFCIFSSLEPPGCTKQQFYRKNFLESCSKHVWLLLGTFLGILKNWKFFQLPEIFPSFDSPGCTGQFFFRQKYLKTSSKHVWTLYGTFLDTSEHSNFRFCFHFIPIFDPSEHDDFKKSPGNMFEHCWVRFWTFLKIWFFFRLFSEVFQVAILQCVLAISFRKKYLKTSSEQASTLLGTVLDTLVILKFSIFSIFSSLEAPGCTEQQFYRKKFLESCSKHVWLLLETFLGILKMWKFFQLLDFVPSFDIPGCTGHFFSEKVTSKQVQNMFGDF